MSVAFKNKPMKYLYRYIIFDVIHPICNYLLNDQQQYIFSMVRLVVEWAFR
jgi:hypothetical protein